MTKRLSKAFSLLLFLSLLVGCAAKKGERNATFEIKASNLVNGTQMNGGIYLWAKPTDQGANAPVLKLILDENDSVFLPFGTFDFHVTGFEGPGAWGGGMFNVVEPPMKLKLQMMMPPSASV